MKKTELAIICLIYSALFLVACKSKPYNAETKELDVLLTAQFGQSLAQDKAIYLLIPSCQCKNCILLNGKNLNPKLKEHLYVITSLDTVNFKNFSHTLYDQNDKVMKLSFLNYANQIVFVDSGHIQNIIRLTNFNTQMDSIQQSFMR